MDTEAESAEDKPDAGNEDSDEERRKEVTTEDSDGTDH